MRLDFIGRALPAVAIEHVVLSREPNRTRLCPPHVRYEGAREVVRTKRRGGDVHLHICPALAEAAALRSRFEEVGGGRFAAVRGGERGRGKGRKRGGVEDLGDDGGFQKSFSTMPFDL